MRTRYHRTVAVTEATSPHTHKHTHEPNLHCDSFSEDKGTSNQYQHNAVGFCPFQTQKAICKAHRRIKGWIYMHSLHLHTYWQLTYFLTHSLHAAVLLEKLTGFQLVKKFPAFYGTRSFITALTSARHLSLSWARSIQSIPSHPTSRRPILILSSCRRPGLPSDLSLRFPQQNSVYASPLSHACYMPRPSHSSRFYHPHNIGWAVQIINPYRTNVENRVSS